MPPRKLIQDLFIRVCKDSGFRMCVTTAAQITAAALKIHPLEIWMAMPDYDTMKLIAAGNHPAVRKG